MAEDDLGLPMEASDPITDIFSDEYTGELETVEDTSSPDTIEEASEEKAPVAKEEATEETEETEVEAEETTEEVEAETDEAADSTEELPPLIAGRFKTQDEADAYTKTTQAAYTRGQQELAATKRQLQMQAQAAEQQAQAQQAQLAQMQAQMQQMQAAQLAQLEQIDPDQAQAIRVQQAQQAQMQQQQAQQSEYERQQFEMRRMAAEQQTNIQIQSRLSEFYGEYPDARGHEDEIAGVIQSFNDLGEGWGIDPNAPDGLEIAYALQQEPELIQRLIDLDLAPDTMRAVEVAREVGDDRQLLIAIRANPAYGATEESLAVARQLLAAPALKKAKGDAEAAAQAKSDAARKAADIEPGNAGTSDESAPGDEWDAIEEWKKESVSALDILAR